MVFFGYNAKGPLTPALSFGSVNASGVVTRFERFEAPYASMVHDFIVTENHLLFPILPLTGSMERAMRGRPPYAWEPDKGAYVGVMKRNGPAEGHRLVPRRDLLRLPRHERVGGRRPHHRRRHAVRGSAAVPPSRRLADRPGKVARPAAAAGPSISPAKTDRFTQSYLDDLTGEFPRIDDRRAGLAS